MLLSQRQNRHRHLRPNLLERYSFERPVSRTTREVTATIVLGLPESQIPSPTSAFARRGSFLRCRRPFVGATRDTPREFYWIASSSSAIVRARQSPGASSLSRNYCRIRHRIFERPADSFPLAQERSVHREVLSLARVPARRLR